jgi:O-acetyl-ADP-ribose deacetylase (regulator of RNase III)
MIKYVTGDATRPQTPNPGIIAHVVNDAGRWGAGFVLAISRRWEKPETQYRLWARVKQYNDSELFGLGSTQFIEVEPQLWIANMVSQVGTGELNGPPIRYGALAFCLRTVAKTALRSGATVHMPRIGCSLAGGKWSQVGPLVEETLCQQGVDVYVYDYPGGSYNP